MTKNKQNMTKNMQNNMQNMTKNMFRYAQYVICYIVTYCNIFAYSTYCKISNMSKKDPHIFFYIFFYILVYILLHTILHILHIAILQYVQNRPLHIVFYILF